MTPARTHKLCCTGSRNCCSWVGGVPIIIRGKKGKRREKMFWWVYRRTLVVVCVCVCCRKSIYDYYFVAWLILLFFLTFFSGGYRGFNWYSKRVVERSKGTRGDDEILFWEEKIHIFLCVLGFFFYPFGFKILSNNIFFVVVGYRRDILYTVGDYQMFSSRSCSPSVEPFLKSGGKYPLMMYIIQKRERELKS